MPYTLDKLESALAPYTDEEYEFSIHRRPSTTENERNFPMRDKREALQFLAPMPQDDDGDDGIVSAMMFRVQVRRRSPFPWEYPAGASFEDDVFGTRE